MIQSTEFPLQGVIGIVANGKNEIQLAQSHGLQCVEMRPDLLLDQGLGLAEVMSMVGEIVTADMHCLFTLRRHDHGGKFTGTDREQMDIAMQAIDAGAHMVDVEWDNQCVSDMLAQGAPVILSNHDFEGIPTDAELNDITDRISELRPAAIKMVTTAQSFDDAVRMLQWVSDFGEGPCRIGFAMGGTGEFSRILTRCFGGPITYATFDAPVAPGQIPVQELLSRYHANAIHQQTRVIGIAANQYEKATWLDGLNQSELAKRYDVIAVPIEIENFEMVQSSAAFLRMDYAVVTPHQSIHLPLDMMSNNEEARLIDFHQGTASSLNTMPEAAINDCIASLNRRYG
ncbi:MAG: type I 3-dehydroquinate dehydratase [Acidiferrobacterales bacterium]|nr:type I 3-dehydroquinate dehydratase [Acidiferrobacterales bacterium]